MGRAVRHAGGARRLSEHKPKTETLLVEAGRKPEWTHGVVNPPVYRASTVVFPTLEALDHATANADTALYYGRRGTPTSWALETALTELEPGAAGTKLFPSGVAALSGALLAVAEAGAHLLVVDSAYEPTRTLCDTLLKQMGVETTYYPPSPGADIAHLIRPNTKAVLVESPGSLTFEVQDIPAIAEAAHAKGAMVIMDNTWATPLLFPALSRGVDISVQSLTKYVVGHSDSMSGAVTANARAWPKVKATANRLGQMAGPDDVFLALRGLRTLSVRLKQHEANALTVAKWLENHPIVSRVRHPAFESCPGHAFFKRDFLGASGLFAVEIEPGSRSQLAAMVDGMRHFKMGFSWGGYESLILAATKIANIRTAEPWTTKAQLLRLHIGLESPDDLIADLDDGFKRYQAV
jgi:cysteine-S-conjugate beta-lyase